MLCYKVIDDTLLLTMFWTLYQGTNKSSAVPACISNGYLCVQAYYINIFSFSLQVILWCLEVQY